jgi:alcohol dehydrogenase (NADP+)
MEFPLFVCTGFAAQSANDQLGPFSFNWRNPGPKDIQLEILYCGVCHSDLHQARNEWHNTVYPCLPGHEIIGRVTKTGAEVTRFKQGDLAGVGCMVDSCRTCASCREGLEQYCEKGFNPTYNGKEKVVGGTTFGGYSNAIVVDEAFVLRVPGNLDLAGVAPLLCAGITTYSPLRHWRVGTGQKVGIVGLGGPLAIWV